MTTNRVRLDRTDRHWRFREFEFLLTGLDLPSADELRRMLVRLLGQDPRHLHPLGWRLDIERSLIEFVPGTEHDAWSRRIIIATDQPPPPVEQLFDPETSLDDLPLRMTVGPDWCTLRAAHTVLDGWSALVVVSHLLRCTREQRTEPPTWSVVRSWHRDLLTAGLVLKRPRAVREALRRHNELSGGPYAPNTTLNGLTRRTFHRAVPADQVTALRELRDSRWPGASMAAVLLVAIRSALSFTIVDPRPGAEVVFNTRSEAAASRRAIGNWSAALFLQADDDFSPESVHRSVAEHRSAGLPLLAVAAARMRRQRGPAPRVAAGDGRPRLTLSHNGGHGPAQDLPWRSPRGAAEAVILNSIPNGPATVTISSTELDGVMHVSLSVYDESWPPGAIDAAMDLLRDDAPRLVAGADDPGTVSDR